MCFKCTKHLAVQTQSTPQKEPCFFHLFAFTLMIFYQQMPTVRQHSSNILRRIHTPNVHIRTTKFREHYYFIFSLALAQIIITTMRQEMFERIYHLSLLYKVYMSIWTIWWWTHCGRWRRHHHAAVFIWLFDCRQLSCHRLTRIKWMRKLLKITAKHIRISVTTEWHDGGSERGREEEGVKESERKQNASEVNPHIREHLVKALDRRNDKTNIMMHYYYYKRNEHHSAENIAPLMMKRTRHVEINEIKRTSLTVKRTRT